MKKTVTKGYEKTSTSTFTIMRTRAISKQKCSQLRWFTFLTQEFLGFHSSDDSFHGLPSCDTVQSGRWVHTFQRNMLPPSPVYCKHKIEANFI